MSLLRSADGKLRVPWVVLLFAAVAVGVESGLVFLFQLGGWYDPWNLDSILALTGTLPTLLAGGAATLVTWLAFREPTGLRTSEPAADFGLGLLAGALVATLACLGPVVAGAATLRWNEGPVVRTGLIQLVALAPAGLGEELLLRGLAFQALRRWKGDLVAVTLSAVLFGVLHLANPHASWVAALIITLVGLWFGAAMVRSGAVWLPMGLHVAWNFFEGFVFGQPVSGLGPGTSLFVASAPGQPGFWSGGAFGPEAAGWTAVVLVGALAVTLRRGDRRSLT